MDLLAYPYGWFNQDIERMAVKAGYKGIFTVNWGVNSLAENPLRIKRRVMENTMGRKGLHRLLTVKPLSIEIIQPDDAGIVGQAPTIKFKITDSRIERVEIKVRSIARVITKDQAGFYSWTGLKNLTPGYYMVIVKGFDEEGQVLMNSWGFYYQK